MSFISNNRPPSPSASTSSTSNAAEEQYTATQTQSNGDRFDPAKDNAFKKKIDQEILPKNGIEGRASGHGQRSEAEGQGGPSGPSVPNRP